MSGNCVNHRWTYYLTNDIDLTGKGYWNDRSTGNNIVFDGKGHKIISDGPAFGRFWQVFASITSRQEESQIA